jgi:hypothetical protein
MSDLDKFGLSLTSHEILKEILPDINTNIIEIMHCFNNIYVKYKNGNLYCITDQINIYISNAIKSLLELQNGVVRVPVANDIYYPIYMKLMINYFLRKTQQLEIYIKENNIYAKIPYTLKF